MPKNYRIKLQKAKTCPICQKDFMSAIGTKEKTTCSYSCSNKYFRSTGKDKTAAYRKACFTINEKKCIVCGESRIVAVHHYDKDHNNMSPDNLIPLCPTHHQYMHSRYIGEISAVVEAFRKDKMKQVAT